MKEESGIVKDISLDDFVGGVFAYSGLECFSSDRKFIHSLFNSFKNKYENKYPYLFEQFSFSKDGIHPFSHILERVLIRLQIADIITGYSFKHKMFRMGEQRREFMIKICEENLKNYIEFIKRLGKMFANKENEFCK